MQSRVLAILIAVVLALVATAAMVVYVNGADRRALNDQEPVYVLRAKRTIPAGTSGEDAQNRLDMIERVTMPRASVVEGTVRVPGQLDQRYAEVEIAKGEVLLLQRWVGAQDIGGRRLLQIPENYQALSIGVDLVRQVAGFVTPGDKVSMVVTLPENEGVDKTRFLLQNVQVLAVGATALTRSQSNANGRVNQGRGSQTLTAVTLAIKKQYVEEVVHAAVAGDIYLTLMPPDADPAPRSQGVTNDNVIPPTQE